MKLKRGIYTLLLTAICLLAFGAAGFAAEGEQDAPPLQVQPQAAPQAQSQARRTKRVALIPLIDRTGGGLTRSGAERLMNRMDRELHVPLNDSMHWVEFINEGEATEAFREALSAQGKKTKPELAARDAAKVLDADLVLLLVVEQYYQYIHRSLRWDWDMVIESSVRLVVYGYDARHDRLIKAPASRFEYTEYHPSYEVEELAADALDEALDAARAKDAIFPLSENK